jgi:xylulose-5-phosphate/fructose-6-phosphate phosphoketolase
MVLMSTDVPPHPADLSDDDLSQIDACWRAANYLSVGQIYLLDNRCCASRCARARQAALLGPLGHHAGLNFLYAHLNRIIRERDVDDLHHRPGHGGPGWSPTPTSTAPTARSTPDITRTTRLRRLFRQFSFPGGIPATSPPRPRVDPRGRRARLRARTPTAPRSTTRTCASRVVGDGEAETGPLATSWHSNKFLNPVNDGVVLPILHLNGYKIANPTVLDRIPQDELRSLMVGYGYNPISSRPATTTPRDVHRRFAALLDECSTRSPRSRPRARRRRATPAWPMIVFRTPKGWTGPGLHRRQEDDGLVAGPSGPLAAPDTPSTCTCSRLAASLPRRRAVRRDGALRPTSRHWRPRATADERQPARQRRAAAQGPRLPDFRDYGVDVPRRRDDRGGDRGARQLSTDVIGSTRTTSGSSGPTRRRRTGCRRCSSHRQAVERREFFGPSRRAPRPAGRVMEMLSEHLCQGWLEGYLLTGRHGLFNCYEAFIHIIDSMFNQHAKWLKVTRHPVAAPDREPQLPAVQPCLAQDHNGFSHQDPGFIDHVVNKSAAVVRVYLPPDANTLLSTYDHCLRSRQYVNVVVAGKQPHPNFLTMDEAIAHCTAWPRHLGMGRQRDAR